MTEATKPQTVAEIIDVLFANGILVELHIGRWTAVRKLHPEDMLMASTINTKLLHTGNKKLVPPESLSDVQECESKARVLLSSRSSPFPISGARYIATHAKEDVVEKLEALKKKFFEEVEEFIEQYPELKEKQLKEFELQADAFAADNLKKSPADQQTNRWHELKEWLEKQRVENLQMYPSVDQLRQKFYFNWRSFQIATPEGEGIQKELQSWPKQASKEAHKALGERALQTKLILEKNEGLTPKNLKPLYEAFEEFKALDFTGVSSYLKVIEAVKASYYKVVGGVVDYSTTAIMLNENETAKKGLAELLTTLAQLSQDSLADQASADALSRSTGFKRFVDLS